MGSFEFLTDYLHRFSEDTLHLVGLGLGLLGSIVGIWAKVAGIRHKKRIQQQAEEQQQLQREMSKIREIEGYVTWSKADGIKMDPKLDYREHRISGGNFLTLRIELSQLGISLVSVTSLAINVDVLPTDGSNLLLNGSTHLSLSAHSMTDDGRAVTAYEDDMTDIDLSTVINVADENPDGISSIPDEFDTWRGLMGIFRHGRSKEVDIPIQTTGSGMFRFKVVLFVRQLRWKDFHYDEDVPPFIIGGETLVGSVNEGPL